MAGKIMELKDMILSTLEELDIEQDLQDEESFQRDVKELTKEVEIEQIDLGNSHKKKKLQEEIEKVTYTTEAIKTQDNIEYDKNSDKNLTFADSLKEENREFLLNLRERILVLFEGFQAPNNQKLEAKVELSLNFFEYLLATIDEKLENSK